ncbi:tape measure protein [Bacteroides acidifaciens]|uniref:tape measure protein n=1 Tax=Bacteroides acidifaciens TaxID=85831 RepID=UPI0025B5AFEC|nr:tape measure protein [Bacteroides acidifaciens]
MDNINGALAFKATLDINDFNVSAQAMERSIKQVSSTAVSESSVMDNSIQSFAQNGAKYIVSYLVGQGMGTLLQSIVQTRGQFQQLEIAFTTMLKSGTQAKGLMDRLIDTAAKTPFDLSGIASSAKQMLAYGSTVDNVVDELVMLGNVASGVGAPLQDIAYLYGTLRTQGRAFTVDIRQFAGRGIPIYEELAKVLGVTKDEVSNLVTEGKVGFAEVEKAFQNMTGKAGTYYNLMQEQSKSLTGMISNMGDAWEQSLNKLGADNQDVFAGAIESATYMAEHLDDILRILKAVAIGYGSVKAAIVLNTLATKGYTGVALLDNTARQAKISLMKLEAVATGQMVAQTKAMVAAQNSHVAALQAQLTVEEHANMVKQLRIATIQQMLTIQQAEYLSNLNLTASSANYEAVALSVLTVEQKQALSKLDLSAKSAVYRAALENEVAVKTQNSAATLNAMRTDVKAAAVKMESARADALAAKAAVERAYLEVYRAQQTGNAEKIAIATKKMEAAEDNAAIARKTALATQSDFYAKKKLLEATATKQSTAASVADTTAKTTQGAVTSVLTAITTKATVAVKALWASMMSNPIGWVMGLIGALVSVITLFTGKQKEATTATGEFQDTTKKEIDDLNLLFAVLQNTEKGTQTHKNTIEKINAVCKQYNKTLLDENATLDLQRLKYEELTTAIQQTTAEKIKAKYTEQAMQELVQSQTDALDKLKENAEDATYKEIQEVMETTPEGVTVMMNKVVDVALSSIRGASGAVWDAVESMAVESANQLKGLTGQAYTDAFNNSLNSIVSQVKQSTSATDKEMDAFKSNIKTYLESIVQSAKKADETIGKVNKELEAFIAPKDTTSVTESTDYVAMSFNELDKKIGETQKSIDTLNAKKVKVEADNTQLKELKDLLDKLNGAVNTKTTNLNTEKGISDRIKQLKDLREAAIIGSSDYKSYDTQIKKLEARLPKHTTGDKADSAAKQLRERQLEADRKLEADRIAVLEEGYEKRKRTLSLQHKEALDNIDKEEKALAKARKDAGKGGLSKSEKDGFDERRTLENKKYDKAQNKLFDGEIEYKKQQYALYFRWVRNMGEDVANTQFATLLKGGKSYKEYVENEIKALKDKQQAGTLTEGESNQLISLNMQYNEITGAKSAMDSFKESVSKTIQQAQTLAEKLEAIADAKEKLANGSSGLVGADEKAEATLFVSEEDEKLQEEVQQKILSSYRTFEEQRNDIQKEYALLRAAAQKTGDQERINQVNKSEAEALSTLTANMLKQSDSWKKLFGDLDSLSVAEIDKLVADIKALGTFYDDYIEAKKKLAEAKANVAAGKGTDEDVKKAEADMKKAAKGVTKSIETITDTATTCGNAIASMFSDLRQDDLANGLGTAMELFGQLGNAAASVGKMMSGDILGGVTGMVSAVTSVVGIFAKLHDSKYEKKIQNLQKEIDALEQSYNRLERAYNNTYWVFNDSQREAYEKNIQLINDQIRALEQEANIAKKNWDFARYAQLNKEIKELNKQLKNAEENGGMFSIYEAQKKNLKQQQEDLRKQIQAEKDKKKTDNGKIQQWNEQIESITQQIEDLDRSMMETLAGTDVKTAIDEFADALVDAYCKGEDAAEALGEKTKEVLKKAVVEALKREFLAKGINDAVLYLGESMKDGKLTDVEKREFERMVNAAGDLFNSALEGIGDWIKDVEEETVQQDPLTGAVTSMSEETGGVIAGRLNAFVINQSDQTSIMRQALVYQAEIAANTKLSASELTEIKTTLKRIENKDSSLLSQGIA